MEAQTQSEGTILWKLNAFNYSPIPNTRTYIVSSEWSARY